MPPIKPEEVRKLKGERIPEPVIEAFNELIVKHWNGREASFRQEEVLRLAEDKLMIAGRETTRAKIFEYRWLDVESAFRDEGWVVQYDKPCMGEDFHAYFVFRLR